MIKGDACFILSTPTMRSLRRLISQCVLFIMALSAADTVPLCAREQGEPIVIGSIVKFRSKILSEERRLFVSLPDGYASSRERYPVLYCLTQADGGDIHYASGVARKMANARIVPRMIVVGLSGVNGRSVLSIFFNDSQPRRNDPIAHALELHRGLC